jgi:c-di-GMP-binding flagellar brake protein YcgR
MRNTSSVRSFLGFLRPYPDPARAELERRKKRRFNVELLVSFRLKNEARTEIRGWTRDFSSGGAFVFLQSKELCACDSAELIVELPAEVTLCDATRVACDVHVLRTEVSGGVIGIAVQIAAFDFRQMA